MNTKIMRTATTIITTTITTKITFTAAKTTEIVVVVISEVLGLTTGAVQGVDIIGVVIEVVEIQTEVVVIGEITLIIITGTDLQIAEKVIISFSIFVLRRSLVLKQNAKKKNLIDFEIEKKNVFRTHFGNFIFKNVFTFF